MQERLVAATATAAAAASEAALVRESIELLKANLAAHAATIEAQAIECDLLSPFTTARCSRAHA